MGELRGRSRLYGLEKAAASGHVIATATEHPELVGALDRDVAGIQRLTARHINRLRTTWATGAEHRPGDDHVLPTHSTDLKNGASVATRAG